MFKRTKLALLCLALALALAACSAGEVKISVNYKDGTYEGRSTDFVYEGDDAAAGDGGYGVVSLTLQGNVITACEFTTYELDGTLKDENYALDRNNRDIYNMAQTAVEAAKVYAEKLVETGDLDKVDAISGATYNLGQFKEAVRDALSKAAQ